MTELDNGLRFADATPMAPRGLGNLVRDHFSNGRVFATVGWHGGLVDVSYWGRQHLAAGGFFKGGLESAWTKLFRPCLGLGSKRYYLPLAETRLFPFGHSGRSRVIGVDVAQELLLLPDAVVQRFTVLRNPKKLPVFTEMFHQEGIVAVQQAHRAWQPFESDAASNAMIASCTDENPLEYRGDDSLSQRGLGLVVKDAPRATTWIGIGCDAPMRTRRSANGFKLYFTSAPTPASRTKSLSFFVVFASSREELVLRLGRLSKHVNRECDELIAGYEGRLASRPRVDVGDPVLNSAFAQCPEIIHAMKVHDRPGAARASQAGGFVWGWDGMMPMVPCTWANEPEYTAAILRFFHQHRHDGIGLPLQFTTAFEPRLKEPFPAQAQFIAGLYQYVATTGDLTVAREVMPTCRFILDRCRERVVGGTGLVAGNALWPDFPEAMDEDGRDISSLNNSLFYQGLRSMEHLAAALGDAPLAVECRDWAARLRASFVKHLYDADQGTFISSCSAVDLKPRNHHCGQAIFWLTPFARELVAHAPGRIAAFMATHLRSAKCLLTLPQWDAAWMADGNQLGSSFPPADLAYLNLYKLIGDDAGLCAWLGDVDWFWRYHTVPEAFTPEAENEDAFGPDNHGGKQLQAVSTWYSCLFSGVAGLDVDHEGITVTPCGGMPVDIRGLRLRGTSIDLRISGRGSHIRSMRLDGKLLPAGTRKIAWAAFSRKRMRLEVVRTVKAPDHPVIVRADGLRVMAVTAASGRLSARVQGDMSGEAVIQVTPRARVLVDGGLVVVAARESSTGCVSVPCPPGREISLDVASGPVRRRVRAGA